MRCRSRDRDRQCQARAGRFGRITASDAGIWPRLTTGPAAQPGIWLLEPPAPSALQRHIIDGYRRRYAARLPPRLDTLPEVTTMGHAEFTLRNQPAQKPLSLDEFWMPFTPNRDFKADPRIVVRAEGMYYWNDRGEKIIDASSGLFCVAAGHGRKEIADAVHRQLRELDFVAPFLRGASEELRARVARRRADAGRPQPHLLRQLGLGSGRHRDEGRARLPPGARAGRAARCSSRASAPTTASTSAASRCRASSTTGASTAPASPASCTCGTRT